MSLVCSGELGGVFLDDAHCSNVNSNDEKSLPEFTPPPRGRRATLGGRDITAHSAYVTYYMQYTKLQTNMYYCKNLCFTKTYCIVPYFSYLHPDMDITYII